MQQPEYSDHPDVAEDGAIWEAVLSLKLIVYHLERPREVSERMCEPTDGVRSRSESDFSDCTVSTDAALLVNEQKMEYGEFQRIWEMIAQHVNEFGGNVDEGEILNLYMLQVEAEIETAAMLYEQQTKAQFVIKQMKRQGRKLVAADS